MLNERRAHFGDWPNVVHDVFLCLDFQHETDLSEGDMSGRNFSPRGHILMSRGGLGQWDVLAVIVPRYHRPATYYKKREKKSTR